MRLIAVSGEGLHDRVETNVAEGLPVGQAFSPPHLRGLGLDRPGERGHRVAGSLAEDCLEIDTGEARLAPYILNEERHLRPMLTHSRELAVHRVRDIDDLVDRRGRGRVEVLLHDEVGLEPGVEVLRVHQGK